MLLAAGEIGDGPPLPILTALLVSIIGLLAILRSAAGHPLSRGLDHDREA